MAIDLGTSKIALSVAKIEGENTQIIYYKETPSEGIRYSRVNNPARVADSIKLAVETAEEELGIKCTEAIVGLPKFEVRQEAGSFSVERDENECVTEEDIKDLKQMAIDSYVLDNAEKEMLYGAVAQSFNDGESFQIVENDIIGMTMERLEGNFKIFIGQTKDVRNIDVAFGKTEGIRASKKYFTPEAIARAVLYDQEMDNGVALIDLGAGVTSVTIYYGKVMRHYAAVPFGGKSITADIKNICGISEKLAEEIKLAYGICMPDRLQNLSGKTLMISTNSALPSQQITMEYLSQIVTARATEIIEAILYEIQASGFADNLRNGIVITGGGANLGNIAALIKEISGYSVRIGYPKHIFSGFDSYDLSSPTSIGLILLGKAEKDLDCARPVVKKEEEEPELAEEVALEPEEDLTDTVFDGHDEEPEEKKSDKKKKKEKKKKKDDEDRKSSWNRVMDFFEDLGNEKA